MLQLRKILPNIVPGWEWVIFCSYVIKGELKFSTMKSGIEYTHLLLIGIPKNSSKVGFFQIGGGIAGDFHLCGPMLYQDMEMHDIPFGVISAISDSTTSYGSYSGAVPNEKNY
jgi:deoxyhypusine synthase